MDCDNSEKISQLKILTEDEQQQLEKQNSRLISEYKAAQLEANARKHWDIFYKRNDTRFFRDRHWTTREFIELLENGTEDQTKGDCTRSKRLLEVGCGVGNFVFPLIEDKCNHYYIFACDFSQRAVDFVKENKLYNEEYIRAFQCDITTNTVFDTIEPSSLDIISVIFVLSAIHPDKHSLVFQNLFNLLKPGGTVLFRDYGRYDMAQLRFKPGNKIADNFYMRQDGTRFVHCAFVHIFLLISIQSNERFHLLQKLLFRRRRTRRSGGKNRL